MSTLLMLAPAAALACTTGVVAVRWKRSAVRARGRGRAGSLQRRPARRRGHASCLERGGHHRRQLSARSPRRLRYRSRGGGRVDR